MNCQRLLIIFTKNPEAGKVKTRLASAIGDEKALEIYHALRQVTARATRKVNAERMVFFSDFIPSSDLFITEGFTARLQEGRDLGERMLHAINTGFEEGFQHIVLIGTDCYELTSAIIESAFLALRRTEAVIGPATDGGFYLIGLNRNLPELFLEREWSTPEVLETTTARLRQLGVAYELLPELSDIDTIEDLKKSGLCPLKQ